MNKNVATMVIVVVLMMALVTVSPAVVADDSATAYTEKVVNAESGANIAKIIEDCESGKDLVINLDPEGSYTFQEIKTINRNYPGHDLTINGNGATVEVIPRDNGTTKVELYYDAETPVDMTNLYDSDLVIKDVRFTLSDSASNCLFSFNYFENAEVTGCEFDTLAFRLNCFGSYNTEQGWTETDIASSYVVRDCDWKADDAIPNRYALGISCLKGIVEGCTVDGYYWGINVEPPYSDMATSTAILDVTVSNIVDGHAVSLAYNSDDVDISGCTFRDCPVGIQMHHSLHADVDIESQDNTFSDVDTEFYYSANDDSPSSQAKIQSHNDRFLGPDGYSRDPSIVSADGASVSANVSIIDPEVIEQPSQPSFDDDDELPPFILSQTGDDDTVTIVACAAAAAVAAITAVFLIIDRKQ